MLKVHRWFILVGLVFIVFIALSTDFKSIFMGNEFQKWVKHTVKEMAEGGISKATLQQFQKEVKDPLTELSQNKVTDKTLYTLKVDDNLILKSRKFFQSNLEELQLLSKQYNVNPNTVTAVVGYGSLFGENVPKNQLVQVLATLAFNNQDSAKYKHELFEFLKLVDSKAIPFNVLGYNDGGFTQLHIFPSFYADTAKDGNGDNTIDLLSSKEDVLASGSNLLKNNGWEFNKPWGSLVSLPVGQDFSQKQGSAHMQDFAAWESLGIKLHNKKDTPPSDAASMLLLLDSPNNGVLLHTNFSVIYKIKGDLQESLTVLSLSSQLQEFNTQINYKQKNVKALKKHQKVYRSKGPKKDDMPVPAKYRYLETIK